MNLIGTQTLQTQRLTLRKLKPSDFDALYESGSFVGNREEARAGFETAINCYNDTEFHWVIEFRGQAVGRIKLWEVYIPYGFGQLGYDVSPECRNMGVMTEALKAVTEYLLKEVQFNRVYAMVRESNASSNRVLEKCGFVHEGIMRQHYGRQSGEGHENMHIWGLLQSDLNR